MNKKASIFYTISFSCFIFVFLTLTFKVDASVEIINLFLYKNNTSPVSNTVIVDEGSMVENVKLLVFDVEVQGGSVSLDELGVELIIDDALDTGDDVSIGFCDGIINKARLINNGNVSQGGLMGSGSDCSIIYYGLGILDEGINTFEIEIDIGPTGNSKIFQDGMSVMAVANSNDLIINSDTEYVINGNANGERQYLRLPIPDEPEIITSDAHNISTSGSVLRGELSDLGDYDEVDIYFQWRKKGSTTWLETLYDKLSQAGTFEAILTGLNSDTEYEYQAVVKYKSDGVNYGGIKTFRTTARSSGGGSGGFTSLEESEFEKEENGGDITDDGMVGILDFNLLMINWNKVEDNNVADLNDDGRVDILDFNILIKNWTR